MTDWRDYFKGKKITVMGMGLQGGVGDIRFLAEAGAELIVTDTKSEDDLTASLEALKAFPDIRYTLGRHKLTDFNNRDLIIKAPTTPLDSPYIVEAKRRGIPVTMWAALFCRFAREMNMPIIGVTGTRGKTTVTLLIAHVLTHAGRTIITGGNVQGTSILSQLPALTQEAIVVLELDSWKLQGFGEERLSPDVAVFTTFFDDHLNYYQGDRERYFMDKAQIFLYQRTSDTLIAGSQVAPLIREKYGSKVHGTLVTADASSVPDSWSLSIPGEHNRYNAGVAIATARTLGIAEETIKEAVESFTGVPGRLECIAEKNGIAYYNDTTATTPHATKAALDALVQMYDGIVLIAGGADKALDMTPMLEAIARYRLHVVLLAGDGTERIKDALPEASVYDTLAGALDAARALARQGDAIVLSPGFASFGMFKNEYDRGDQFNDLVATI